MGKYVGLVPVPKDKPLGEFIAKLIERDHEVLEQKLGELQSTVLETGQDKQPIEFAYAKMLNHLKDLEWDDIVHLLAAALWELNPIGGVEDDGQT